MTNRHGTLSPILLVSALTLFAAPAFALSVAEDCASDADCSGEGAICQKSVSSSGCAVGPDGDASDCKSETTISEMGYCYTPPPTCDSDSDCGEYLSCVQENFGTCTGGVGMETVCEEDLGEAYCSYVTQECTGDSDCPREFECVEAPVNCLLIGCLEGDDDCDSACESDGVMECRPMEMECDTDDQCPSDWSCWGTVDYECTGGSEMTPGDEPAEADGAESTTGAGDAPSDSSSEGGSTGGEDFEQDVAETRPSDPVEDPATGPDGTPLDPDGELRLPVDPDGEGQDEFVCKEVPRTGYCAPDAWESNGLDIALTEDSAGAPTIGGEANSGSNGDDEARDGDTASPSPNTEELEESGDAEEFDGSEAAGGCSVAPNQQGGAGWLLGLLFIIPGLRRRFASVN